jgi:hypothetical protein
MVPDSTAFPESSPAFPFLSAIVGSLHNVAPERADEVLAILGQYEVRLVIDQDLERVFRARITDGRRDLRCSIYGAEVVWAASLAYVTVHKQFKENVGESIRYADHFATRWVPLLLDFAFNRRIARRSKEPWPGDLPTPRFPVDGQEVDVVPLATHLWLMALAWILHHELTHIRLGHLDRGDARIDDEIAADEGATDWLLQGVRDPNAQLVRSLGIAIAVVTLAGFSLHRGMRSVQGNRSHPPAGERILRALSHPTFDDDHPAQELALIGAKMHLDSFDVTAPQGPFDTSSDCPNAYCRILIDWELRRS